MSTRMSMCSAIALVALTSHLYAATPPRDPAAAKETFMDISGQLELGGDLFIVANIEGMLEGYMDTLLEFVTAMPLQPGSEQEQITTKCKNIAAFLECSGLYAIKGFGFSVVPLEDGNSSITSFVSRDPAAANLPLWRGIVGTTPIDMQCLQYLPADTVIARSGTMDARYMWALAKEAITDIGGEEAAQSFQAGLAMAQQQLGVSLDELIRSIAPEGVVSIQLSRAATSTIPLGMQTIDIPQPSLLLVTKVNNNTLLDTVKRMAKQAMGQELPATQLDDATVYTLPVPMPLPVPVSITLARHGEYLLLGSTTDVVKQALAAAGDNAGLLADADFQQAFPGKMAANNGIMYVSERFSKNLAAFQMRMMEQTSAGNPEAREMMSVFRSFHQNRDNYACALTINNLRSGVKVSGWSTAGGRELITSAAIAPVGLMAAIAIPSFVKARSTAQQNACINNLRQLDAAKEQWALATGQPLGAAPVESEVLEYIKGTTMPVCPQGGTYSLHPIGQNPTCSHPGHALNH